MPSKRHYHVEVIGSIRNMPEMITHDESKAKAYYNAVVNNVINKTELEPIFYGSNLASFPGGLSLLLRSCEKNCKMTVKEES